jgi:hypothetical protein
MSREDFQLGFEISPIIFVGGIAASFPGQMEPIIMITQSQSYTNGLLSGPLPLDPDSYFARFKPIGGNTLSNNQIGQYPFANQSVAANAIIAQPLSVSLEMICPARDSGGMASHLITLTSLKQAIDKHTALGGTYIVATPSFLYVGCILLGLRDITGGDSKQSGIQWQWDFTNPLITQTEEPQKLSSLMSIIGAQTYPGVPAGTTPAWSSPSTAAASNNSGPLANLIPSGNNVTGMQSGRVAGQ